MPIACGQVMLGATWVEITPATLSPAASASGTLPTKPIRRVETAAASAVAVISAAWASLWPWASGPDSSSGLRSRM